MVEVYAIGVYVPDYGAALEKCRAIEIVLFPLLYILTVRVFATNKFLYKSLWN